MTRFVFMLVLIALLISACSESAVEEFAFRKSLEHDLIELCGDDDPECVQAVKAQMGDCMVASEWRRYLEDSENDEELRRFTRKFYACIVDDNGEPYFESTI